METIPTKDRQEWRSLLNGQLNVRLKNFVLQMQVDQTKRAIRNAEMTLEDGVDKIHALCEKYSLAVRTDMKTLFSQSTTRATVLIK